MKNYIEIRHTIHVALLPLPIKAALHFQDLFQLTILWQE